MPLATALEQAWKDVERTCKGGYLVSQSMLVFAWGKAILELRPDLHITYEADASSVGADQPTLVIWQDGEPPSALFAGELKFLPGELMVSELIIAKLQYVSQNPGLAVPMRDPKSGEITRHQVAKSDDFALGLFIVAHRDAAEIVHAKVLQNLTESGRAIFHFAFGVVSDDPALDPVFQYVSPGSMP